MPDSGVVLFLLLLAVTLLAVYVALDRLHSRRVAVLTVATLVALAIAIALFVGFLAATWADAGGGWRPTR